MNERGYRSVATPARLAERERDVVTGRRSAERSDKDRRDTHRPTRATPRPTMLIAGIVVAVLVAGGATAAVLTSASEGDRVEDVTKPGATLGTDLDAKDAPSPSSATAQGRTRLTGQEICDKVGTAAVAAAMEQPVNAARQSDMYPSRCEFMYPADEDNTFFVNITDVTGNAATPEKNFEDALEIFGEDATVTPLDAGDRAVSLAKSPGPAPVVVLSGLVLVGPHVFHIDSLDIGDFNPRVPAMLRMAAETLA